MMKVIATIKMISVLKIMDMKSDMIILIMTMKRTMMIIR